MAASSEEASREIPSREVVAAQIPLVFRSVHSPCASKDCLSLLSQGEASIASCPASTHCDGSGRLSPENTPALLALRTARGRARGSFQYPEAILSKGQRPTPTRTPPENSHSDTIKSTLLW